MIDREVAETKFYGYSDGTMTGYMKIVTEQLLGKFLPYGQKELKIIGI